MIAAGLVGAACFHPSYSHPACGPDGECPSGWTCNPLRICDGPPGAGEPGISGAWTFDSAAEFAAPGHAVQDVTIEPRGSLTPNAYTYGGLVGHGLEGTKLWAHGDTSWAKLDMVTASGTGLWRGESLANTDALDYLGIATSTTATIWFEGEVWLDAGAAETFGLTCDDVGFLELARPGTADYARVIESGTGITTAAVATPDAGWYPIRIGVANGDAALAFTFSHSDAGTALVPWTRDRLRARASELGGALRMVFGRQLLGGGPAAPSPISHVEDGALLAQTSFVPPPQGASATDWSSRYFGQVYLAEAGAYTLRVSSDDGSRARLATGRGASVWARDQSSATVVTTATADLIAGWNDLNVDYNQVGGGERLAVQLDGPEFASVEVPRDRLRPVEAADDRLVFAADATAHVIPRGGGPQNPGTATLTVAGYASEVVTSIDVTYEIDTSQWNELMVDLETPGAPGTRVTIQAAGVTDIDGIAQVTVPAGAAGALAGLLGGPAGGTWRLHAYQLVTGRGQSTLKRATLTLHTTGGPDKVARTASWTSPVLASASDVLAIDGVTWDARLPDGAALKVHVKACQQADCSDATWSDPVTPSTPFTVGRVPFLQLRVDLSSNGTLEPELRSLAVTYRRDPG